MDDLDLLIDQALTEQKGLTDEQKAALKQMSKEALSSGKSPTEVLQFSPKMVEALYSHAYHLYQAAKYGSAGHIFQLLSFLSPRDPRFYMGAAACLHRMKEYVGASFLYEAAGTHDPQNPMPYYYQSDCRTELKQWGHAMASLLKVIEIGKDQPMYTVVVDRARLTLAKLQLDHPEYLKEVL